MHTFGNTHHAGNRTFFPRGRFQGSLGSRFVQDWFAPLMQNSQFLLNCTLSYQHVHRTRCPNQKIGSFTHAQLEPLRKDFNKFLSAGLPQGDMFVNVGEQRHMEVSQNEGTPTWMVRNGKSKIFFNKN